MNNLFLALLTVTTMLVVSVHAIAAEKLGQTKAGYNAAKARADSEYNVARVRCKDFARNDRDVCVQKAKAARVKAKAEAKANFESAGESKLEGRADSLGVDYQVAKEKCESISDETKELCVADAKIAYANSEPALETREYSMEADYQVAHRMLRFNIRHCAAGAFE